MAKKRKTISKKIRFDVFKRDSFTCQYCGSTPPNVVLQVDHIDPVSKGGGNDINNLITSCQPCNIGKFNHSLSDIPQSLKDRAKDVKEQEAQIVGYNKIIQSRTERIERESWVVAESLEGIELESYSKSRLQSIRTFIKKLPTGEVIEAAEITASRYKSIGTNAFRYFCGICWRKIRGEDHG